MLGGMEPQPERKVNILGFNHLEMVLVQRIVLSRLSPANAAILPFAASCAGQDCCSPPGSTD